jgi:signal transduction histidine kinase
VKGTRVWITDDGPGIPETDQAIVFERGYSTKEGPIHGHGLAIVERVVREHGGSVSATKGVDLPGAMFIITFPAPPKLNG